MSIDIPGELLLLVYSEKKKIFMKKLPDHQLFLFFNVIFILC